MASTRGEFRLESPVLSTDELRELLEALLDRRLSVEEAVRRILGLPPGVRVLALVAVGHPAEEKPGHPADGLDRSKIRRNGWLTNP